MTLTHNGITYEPPVSDKEHKDYIEAKVDACNHRILEKEFVGYLVDIHAKRFESDPFINPNFNHNAHNRIN